MTSLNPAAYRVAIEDLRGLLRRIGRADFRSYGYWRQLCSYRARLRNLP